MPLTLPQEKPKMVAQVMQHASGDKRFKILDTYMKRHLYKSDALIEVLHKAQELFGFLDNDLLLFIAYRLRLPPSRVYGVATFYHFFTLKPHGKHTCVICMGTACYVKGADRVIAAVEDTDKDQARRDDSGQGGVAPGRPLHRRLRPGTRGGLRRNHQCAADSRVRAATNQRMAQPWS